MADVLVFRTDAEPLIRDIPEDHYRRLQGLAERHGISLEEYVRGSIIDAVRDHGRRNAGEVLEEIRRTFPDVGFEEGEIKGLREVLRGSIEPVDFSDH